MSEVFRLKVAARRQVTMPTRVLELLHLSEGDMIEIDVDDNGLVGRGLKLVPTNLFTPELLQELSKREKEMATEPTLEVADLNELRSDPVPPQKRARAAFVR